VHRFALLATLAALAACAHNPELFPLADSSPQAPHTAAATTGGVRVVVDGEPWHGRPGDLPATVLPVRVTVENQSSEPVRVAYPEFVLTTPDGMSRHALSPYSVQRPGQVVSTPAFPMGGFWIAQPWAGYYPWLSPWDGPFAFDSDYYDTYRVSESLPSRDMLAQALPEGVLQPGGRVTGYLYFQPLHHVSQVTFQAQLDDARTHAQIGRLAIPFRAEHT